MNNVLRETLMDVLDKECRNSVNIDTSEIK